MENNPENRPGAAGQSDSSPISSLTQERATESNAIEIPSISLPKSGGVIKGISENIAANPATGTASIFVQDSVEVVDAASLETLLMGVGGSAYQWNDLHVEVVPGFLIEQENNWLDKSNISPVSERMVNNTLLEFVPKKLKTTIASVAPVHGSEHSFLCPRFYQTQYCAQKLKK